MDKNVYYKYVPNVYLAQCTAPHEKGEVIPVTTQRGKENDSIVHNFIAKKGDYWYYSITRADGFDSKAWAERRAERLNKAAENSLKKADTYYEKAQEGKDFLVLGEPIKIGHHSEKRHRALIERNQNNFGKYVQTERKAQDQTSRAEYWEEVAETIMNLSMPESLIYYEVQLEKAQYKQAKLKSGELPREHSFSLTYATKAVKDLTKKLAIAKQLWGEKDEPKAE
jgi:hypothetical protein